MSDVDGSKYGSEISTMLDSIMEALLLFEYALLYRF